MDSGSGSVTNGTAVTIVSHIWRQIRREYRHRSGHCSRLLFTGYLGPGTRIEMRCPACGRIHVIETL
jgi:hypothetical protein